jgi:hypothetical protein
MAGIMHQSHSVTPAKLCGAHEAIYDGRGGSPRIFLLCHNSSLTIGQDQNLFFLQCINGSVQPPRTLAPNSLDPRTMTSRLRQLRPMPGELVKASTAISHCPIQALLCTPPVPPLLCDYVSGLLANQEHT